MSKLGLREARLSQKAWPRASLGPWLRDSEVPTVCAMSDTATTPDRATEPEQIAALHLRPHVVTGDGSLAASWLQFNGRVRQPGRPVLGFLSTSSMVFRRTGDGWRIVREH